MPVKAKLKKFMIIILLVAGLLIAAFIGWLAVLGKMSQSGQPPGLVDGKLTPCPDKRNCVCSEYANDSLHFVEPLLFANLADTPSMSATSLIVKNMGGVIQQQNDYYLAATFSSDLFGFVDDLELRLAPEEKLIHIRSGSRVGDSDLGVNRKRVEQFRNQMRNSGDN